MIHEIHTHTHKQKFHCWVWLFFSLHLKITSFVWAKYNECLAQFFVRCVLFSWRKRHCFVLKQKKALHSLGQLVVSVPDGTWFRHQNLANTLFLSVELFYFIFYILQFSNQIKLHTNTNGVVFPLFSFFHFFFRQKVHIRIKCECHHHHVWPNSNRTCITILTLLITIAFINFNKMFLHAQSEQIRIIFIAWMQFHSKFDITYNNCTCTSFYFCFCYFMYIWKQEKIIRLSPNSLSTTWVWIMLLKRCKC